MKKPRKVGPGVLRDELLKNIHHGVPTDTTIYENGTAHVFKPGEHDRHYHWRFDKNQVLQVESIDKDEFDFRWYRDMMWAESESIAKDKWLWDRLNTEQQKEVVNWWRGLDYHKKALRVIMALQVPT